MKLGVGGVPTAGLHIEGTQSGWLYGSWQVHHLSDEFNFPGSIPEGVGSCLWDDVPKEGFESRGELAEKVLEGLEYTVIIRLKRRDESSSQEVDEGKS